MKDNVVLESIDKPMMWWLLSGMLLLWLAAFGFSIYPTAANAGVAAAFCFYLIRLYFYTSGVQVEATGQEQ